MARGCIPAYTVQINPMRDPFFFGYGSLVNRATHDFPQVHRASVTGWRRVWRHTSLRPVAFLTVERHAASRIQGLMAAVPGADWAALDAREYAYDRTDVGADIDHGLTRAADVAIYTIPEGKHGSPTKDHPILLSYLDVVVQGYLREFGESGVARFFETTRGWTAPIRDDRSAPAYPRHQKISAKERSLVDHHLRQLSAVVDPQITPAETVNRGTTT